MSMENDVFFIALYIFAPNHLISKSVYSLTELVYPYAGIPIINGKFTK